MIRLIGNHGCGRCSTVKKLFEEKGVEFKYEELNKMTADEQTGVLNMAKASGQTSLPIVMKDGKIIDFRGVIA